MKSLCTVAALFLVMSCGPGLYSKRELRTQLIPKDLQNKTWILRKIYSKKILGDSLTSEFNNSNGDDNCGFTFEFAEKGELFITFKEYKFKGVYVLDHDRFKFLYSGYKEKIIWTATPECTIGPNEIGYILNWRRFDFKIEGKELTLTDANGDRLVLTTSI